MITLKFIENFSQDAPDTYSLNTYKEFFEFWVRKEKFGRIFSVFDDGDTQ